MTKTETIWQWATFEELSTHDLYSILKIRQAVFVVEQDCVYQDVDDLDFDSWHLVGRQVIDGRSQIVAYLRVVQPGLKYPEISIGRVLTALRVRRTDVGRALMGEALVRIGNEFSSEQPIRISAQKHLEDFYAEFGFECASEPYLEDGIPHIEMLRP